VFDITVDNFRGFRELSVFLVCVSFFTKRGSGLLRLASALMQVISVLQWFALSRMVVSSAASQLEWVACLVSLPAYPISCFFVWFSDGCIVPVV